MDLKSFYRSALAHCMCMSAFVSFCVRTSIVSASDGSQGAYIGSAKEIREEKSTRHRDRQRNGFESGGVKKAG